MTDRFFLKSVAVENFKAVRRSGTVKLTPLTVFIGNNGSGKSSLIEALETYRAIVLEGLDTAMNHWHGIEHVWNKRATHRRKVAPDGHDIYENRMMFRLKGLWYDGSFDVRLEAGPEVAGDRIRIEDEVLEFPAKPGRSYRRNGTGTCNYRRGPGDLFSEGIPGTFRYLPGESAAPPDWKEAIRRWQFLALNPDPMGQPASQRMTGGPPMLNRDGSDLGQYLWSLREASVEAFNDLLDVLQFVLPF